MSRRKHKQVQQVETVEISQAVQMPTVEQLEQQGFKTKAARVRYLLSQGFEVNQIAKGLNMLYQHVYNVKSTPLKKPE